jgi:ubiquinone/menaquinone biosynthesis methyltransferase
VPAGHPWLAAILDLAMRPMYPARRLVVPAACGEVLEIGVGTGLNLALYDPARVRRVTALDPDPHMLRRARERAAVAPVRVDLVQAAAELIPCTDARFDTVLVTWTICTVEDPGATLAEVRRVLRPGGRLAILEITQPRGPLKPFFSLWFDRIVPLLGRILPGGKAYTYLPASVRRFPGAEELAALVATTGFEDVSFRLFGGTIVALHTATAR